MANYSAVVKFQKLCLNYSVLWGEQMSLNSNLFLKRKIKNGSPHIPQGVCLDCVFLRLDLYVFINSSNGEHCRELKMYFGGQTTTKK